MLYTRDDPWIVHVVPTISYRGDHYEKKPRPSADDAENARIDELREKAKRKSRQKRGDVLRRYQFASLAPITNDATGEGPGACSVVNCGWKSKVSPLGASLLSPLMTASARLYGPSGCATLTAGPRTRFL